MAATAKSLGRGSSVRGVGLPLFEVGEGGFAGGTQSLSAKVSVHFPDSRVGAWQWRIY